MPELNAEQREALDELTEVLSCSQCGRSFSHRACGPTHAIIAANPRQHRLIAPLIAAAQREAAQAVLDAVEGLHRPIRACDKPDCTLVHCAYDTGAFPCQTVQKARAAAAKYGVGTAAGEAERTEPHNCDGCVDLALAANNTRLPRRSDGHFVDCAAAGGDGR